jgi:hypothetical protein
MPDSFHRHFASRSAQISVVQKGTVSAQVRPEVNDSHQGENG